MKKILTLAISCLFVLNIFGESTIKGKVVDENTQSPIDYANVTVFQKGQNTPLHGSVSDEKGMFEIKTIPNGQYTLQVTFVGYNIYIRNFTVSGEDISFGAIRLKEDSKLLNELEVVGQGSQMRFEIDRKVFSVDQNIASAGGSATEVLENIPSVEVDQEGNISLRSNESVEVWINGKPSGLTADNRAQILQQMPAESIESIEILTNPSAKYDPEGTAGIINLVLKKERKGGYYGSVTAGVMYPDGGKLGGNIGANFNYSSSKIDAYINAGYRRMSREGGSWSNLWQYNSDNTTLRHQEENNSSFHGGLFVRAGIDYHMNDKNTLSLSGFGMSGGGDTKSSIYYSEKNLNTDTTTSLYGRNNKENSDRNNFSINLDYRHEFDKKGTDLLASVSYSQHKRSSKNNYLQTNSFPVESESESAQNTEGNNNQLQIKVDYTNKITETGRLEAGLQSNIQKRYSNSDGYNAENDNDNNIFFNVFDYKEQIHAAYVTYGDRFFDKLSFQVGLRGEYMWREAFYEDYMESNPLDYNSYFELFPSLYLGYAITKRDEIQFNYTRRVNRPRGWQINPFRDHSDPTNISFGNKYLNPEFSSAFELNYLKNWDYHSFSASLYYRFTDDVIQRIRYRVEDNIENNTEEIKGNMESTFMNISQSNNTGLELILKNRLFRILNLTTSANLYYRKINSASYDTPYGKTEFIKGEEGFSWDGRIIANVMITPTFSGQITGRYNSPRAIAQGKQEADYSVDLGIRKSFFNRNLNLNLNVRDLFNSRRRKTNTSGDGFEQYSESYWHGRSFGLTVSYNFGNMKSSRNVKRNQGTDSSMDMEMEMME